MSVWYHAVMRRMTRILVGLVAVVALALAGPIRAYAMEDVPRTQEEAWAVLAKISGELAGMRREQLSTTWWQQNGLGSLRGAIYEALDGRLREIRDAAGHGLTAREIWDESTSGAAKRYMAQIRGIRTAAERASEAAAAAQAAEDGQAGWRGRIAEIASGLADAWAPIRDTSTWVQETARRIQDLSYPQQRSAAETLSRIWGVWSQGCGSVGTIPSPSEWLGLVPDGVGQTCDMVRSLRGIGASLEAARQAEWRPDTEEHCGAICRVARDVGQWREQREQDRWERTDDRWQESGERQRTIAERLGEIAKELKRQGQGGQQPQPEPDPQGPDWRGAGAGDGLAGWGGVGSCMALPAPSGDCGDGPALDVQWAGRAYHWTPLRGICAVRPQIEPWVHVAGAVWIVGCGLLAARWLAASYGISTPGRGAEA